ncbi:MAG: translation initiation factor 2 [Pseudomonadota bacterium]|nr:translation initiation factor 2 [Pseudomonadota bacterium]
MTEDPRRAVVEVIGRLGRETQLHLDERHRHFRITDAVIIAISLLLVILAIFNVYYVRVLYEDLNGIVSNMESMHAHLVDVDGDMGVITEHMASFERHMTHMEPINGHMAAVAGTLPSVRADMDGIVGEMTSIEESMGLVGRGMGVIDLRVHLMNGGVAAMRANVSQIARPMGGMMPFMP